MLYIRTDMNECIATGHVMRCIAVAEAAEKMGEAVTFLLSDRQAVDLLKKCGYRYIVLDTCWSEMEGELSVIKSLIRKHRINTLLIDSYQVTETYLAELSGLVRTAYFDDLNKFYYSVDVLICYANYWKKFGHKERYKDTKLLLGMQYVPLRKAFSGCPKKQIRSKAESVLLLSGGTDKGNVLGNLLARMERKRYRRITVICGKYNCNYDGLSELYKNEENVCIYNNISDIERYMQEADMAVSAGGTTLYELCACGTPSISYAAADNQIDNVEAFHKQGLIDCAGDARINDVTENICNLLEQYYEDAFLRSERSCRMQMAVDGEGAKRIAEVLREN